MMMKNFLNGPALRPLTLDDTDPVLTEREELLSLYSDMHKDAYGFRPREWQWPELDSMSIEQLKVELDKLQGDVESAIAQEAAEEQAAAEALAQTVLELMNEQGISLADAYRWLMQAEGCENDLDHFLWRMGVGCGRLSYQLKEQLKTQGVA
jgi:hypothetical protein